MITPKLLYCIRVIRLVVHELAVGARTCTQPLSELATASAGCGEVPEPISGRRRRVWGSWHLQIVHASDQCDLVVHGGADNSPAECVLAPAPIPMLSAPISVISKRARGYKELPGSLLGVQLCW